MATNLTVEAMRARADDLNIHERSDQFPISREIDDLVRTCPAADIVPRFAAEAIDKPLIGLSVAIPVAAQDVAVLFLEGAYRRTKAPRYPVAVSIRKNKRSHNLLP